MNNTRRRLACALVCAAALAACASAGENTSPDAGAAFDASPESNDAPGCADDDNDGVCDLDDVCPGSNDGLDADADTVPDGCDACPGSDDAFDADSDSVPDGCDVCVGFDDRMDSDNDATPDGCDLCPGFDDNVDANNNGIPDACENGLLLQVCGNTINGLVCSGNCTNNTAQYTEAYCQIEGHHYATNYVEITTGSQGPTVQYQNSSSGLPETCAEVIAVGNYPASGSCTCASNLQCADAGTVATLGTPINASSPHIDAQRGNIILADTNNTIYNFRANFNLPNACNVDWYIHEGTSINGPWTVVWSGSTFVQGNGHHLSGPVRYQVTSGRYYVLSAAWDNCTGALYAFTPSGSVDAGFGNVVGYTFDNQYPGYSTNYQFPDSGSSTTVFYGEMIVASD